MKNKGNDLLKSRKFWAAVVAIAYCVIYQFWPDWPIPEETIVGVVATVVSYILGVALEDGLSKKNDIDFRNFGNQDKEE